MGGLLAIYRREMLLLRRRFLRICLGMSVSPVLYVIAFGYGLGGGDGGQRYLQFLIPGLVAMNSMTQAFGVATEINLSRFYLHIFEEFQAAPITTAAYVGGEVLAGMTRAGLAAVIIIVIGGLFGIHLHCGPLFWLAVALNSFVFASLAVWTAMIVKTHADHSMLSNFVITPMAFLGGTLFPLDRLPDWAQQILMVSPLAHASRAIRATASAAACDWRDFAILAVLGAGIFCVAFRSVDRARD
jgi:Nod factor-specific ABC transporter NodJ protein